MGGLSGADRGSVSLARDRSLSEFNTNIAIAYVRPARNCGRDSNRPNDVLTLQLRFAEHTFGIEDDVLRLGAIIPGLRSGAPWVLARAPFDKRDIAAIALMKNGSDLDLQGRIRYASDVMSQPASVRPNALASAARATIHISTAIERRWPCLLHAVIRPHGRPGSACHPMHRLGLHHLRRRYPNRS